MLQGDQDFSFIRLRDNQEDAVSTFSPVVEISYAGYQIHLKPNEPIFQITNSPTNINLETYKVELLDNCGNVLEDITGNIFITPFSDRNGVSQIAWEWVNTSNYPGSLLQMRWTDTADGNQWWTNYFISSNADLEETVRFDYNSNDYHYGTDYTYAGISSQTNKKYFQSIRLRMYYNNMINESERSEYHQISTDITIATRNIKKWKERYILDSFDDFTIQRLETLITSDFVYTDRYRTFSSTPIEFSEREMSSDISEAEAILNKDYSQSYDWLYQEFAGAVAVSFTPNGSFVSGTSFAVFTITYSANIELVNGTVTVYDSSNNLLATYTEADMSVNGTVLTIVTALSLADGDYYVNVSEGLVTFLGLESEAITDNSAWTFAIQGSDFNSADYNNDDYLT